MDKKKYHFYHCYADGEWIIPVNEHIGSLLSSGLYDALDSFYVGIVGLRDNRKKLKDYINSFNITYSICDERDIGWEQVTLNKLYEFSILNTGHVLYAHTKASYNNTISRGEWRRKMTKINVMNWEECISQLDENDAVGGYWLEPEPDNRYYAGNFWWADLNFIQKVGYPKSDDRWCAESWIGSYRNAKFCDLAGDSNFE